MYPQSHSKYLFPWSLILLCVNVALPEQVTNQDFPECKTTNDLMCSIGRVHVYDACESVDLMAWFILMEEWRLNLTSLLTLFELATPT
jgi:hypothetical protein